MAGVEELDARIKRARKNVETASAALAKQRELHPSSEDKSDPSWKRLASFERTLELFEDVLERLLAERKEI